MSNSIILSQKDCYDVGGLASTPSDYEATRCCTFLQAIDLKAFSQADYDGLVESESGSTATPMSKLKLISSGWEYRQTWPIYIYMRYETTSANYNVTNIWLFGTLSFSYLDYDDELLTFETTIDTTTSVEKTVTINSSTISGNWYLLNEESPWDLDSVILDTGYTTYTDGSGTSHYVSTNVDWEDDEDTGIRYMLVRIADENTINPV